MMAVVSTHVTSLYNDTATTINYEFYSGTRNSFNRKIRKWTMKLICRKRYYYYFWCLEIYEYD